MGSVKDELHLGGEFISAGFVLVSMITMLIVNSNDSIIDMMIIVIMVVCSSQLALSSLQ